MKAKFDQKEVNRAIENFVSGTSELDHKKELPPLMEIGDIVKPIGILPISRSTWYDGIKSGIYPKPIKLSARRRVWRREDVLAIITGVV